MAKDMMFGVLLILTILFTLGLSYRAPVWESRIIRRIKYNQPQKRDSFHYAPFPASSLLFSVTQPSAPPTSTSSSAAPHQGHGGMGHGSPHGHGGGPPVDPNSFVQNEMRNYAMKLHTRDQAPKEGRQKAEIPFTQWEPSRGNYLQFLVDSLEVYRAIDDIVEGDPRLSALRNTGLERSKALQEDIKWMLEYDKTLQSLTCGENGRAYASFLKQISKESIPKFICHYYNHYFAHTAGGRMIGKKMADKLLGGSVLKFYEWEGDVKVLLDNTRKSIDAMAATWSQQEKQACLEETAACFKFGGSLMVYMRPPGSGGH